MRPEHYYETRRYDWRQARVYYKRQRGRHTWTIEAAKCGAWAAIIDRCRRKLAMATETFKQARARLLEYLAANGWDVHTTKPGGQLKVPYALLGDQRLSFRTQAIYLGEHSLVFDMRTVTGAELFNMAAERGAASAAYWRDQARRSDD